MISKTKRSIQWIKTKKQKHAGIHLIADFWGSRNIEEPKKLRAILITAAKKAKNTPLEVTIHKFLPRGITGVILLAESHIALHSWPEREYLAIDIFTCGEKKMPRKALEYLRKVYNPKKIEVNTIKRGKIQ